MNDAECKAAQILRPGVVWGIWIYPPHITHGLEAVGTQAELLKMTIILLNQEPLGCQFEKVLYESLPELYED